MADAHVKHHDYHLVDPSPWPIVGAISAFVLALGFISVMHGSSLLWLVPGFLGVFYTMAVWWRDVIKEAHTGYHTPVVQLHLRYGMFLFIASEVMFFVAWFWAFFDASLFPNDVAIDPTTGEVLGQVAREAFTGGIYGSTFFMATGFHGAHVIIGTIFLIVCLFRALRGHFTPQQHFGFEAAAWYWHFVDVVWLFLFVSVYVWGGWGAPIHG